MHSGVTILLEWVFNLDDFNKIFLQIAPANIWIVEAQIMRETCKTNENNHKECFMFKKKLCGVKARQCSGSTA